MKFSTFLIGDNEFAYKAAQDPPPTVPDSDRATQTPGGDQ